MSTDNKAATNIATATKEAAAFELTPPDPVPVIEAEQAAGLVPVSTEQKSKLDQKVDSFVADLVAADANSP
ncbi:MAG: toxic anion resistance protein, partial [Erythrobacter sp.]|nr:toxic anion resistance protein [Erythrobacter sp.]